MSSSSSSVAETTVEADQDVVAQVVIIPVKKIVRDPNNPRTYFDQGKIEAMAETIKAKGDVNDPISVVLFEDGYMLVSGARRLSATKLAGIDGISSIVKFPMSTSEHFKMALVSNLGSVELDLIDEAYGFRKIRQDYFQEHGERLSAAEIAKMLGVSTSKVTNALKIFQLHPDIRKRLTDRTDRDVRPGLVLPLVTWPQDEQPELFEFLLEEEEKLNSGSKQGKRRQIPQNKITFMLKVRAERTGVAPKKGSRSSDGLSAVELVLNKALTALDAALRSFEEVRNIAGPDFDLDGAINPSVSDFKTEVDLRIRKIEVRLQELVDAT